MAIQGDKYTVEIKPSHIDWGEYRNPTNRTLIEGESYVKIPSKYAREFDIKRGDKFLAYFGNVEYESMEIKASGNGPCVNGVQYAKQFEGIGKGACKAFTPWYQLCGANVGDIIQVEFISSTEIKFTKL